VIRATLVGDNREVGRGTRQLQSFDEASALLGFGLGTKLGIEHLGELLAVNGVAYINHTAPFSKFDRPDLAERLPPGTIQGPPTSSGLVLTSYVFFLPRGSRPDQARCVEDSRLSDVYVRLLAERSGAQFAVATASEFEEVTWHAFQRPPIYGESVLEANGSLKPEYLQEGRWHNVLGLTFGFVQRQVIHPGEHRIVSKGQDHTHFLRLEATVLEELIGDCRKVVSADPPVTLQRIFHALRPCRGRQNPVHIYPNSRIRRAVLMIFELEEF
jgi:hypothetical protein